MSPLNQGHFISIDGLRKAARDKGIEFGHHHQALRVGHKHHDEPPPSGICPNLVRQVATPAAH